MFELSQMIQSIQGSERSQRKIEVPPGASRLDMGEPDFSTPVHIQEAACKAMRDNYTHYINAFGDLEMREAVVQRLYEDHGARRPVEDVLVTAGGIEGIHLLNATFLNRGDEVIIMDPEYSAYADSINIFGGVPVPVRRTPDLRPDLEAVAAAVTLRTKSLIISNPGNPTGIILTEGEVRALAEIALEHDLILAVDEVYGKLVYGGQKHFSICQIEEVRDRAVILQSLSKTYAMTGWRVGYMVADSPAIKKLVKLHKAFTVCVNAPSQKAAAAALNGPQDCVAKMREEYNQRRMLVESALAKMERIEVIPCQGAFYSYPRFHHNITSLDMTSYLAERRVLVRSGTEFGAGGQGHIRLAFTRSREALEEGMRRLGEALARLD